MMGTMYRSRSVSLLALVLTTGLLVGACSSSGNKAAFCKRAGDLKDLGNSVGHPNGLPEVKSAFAKLTNKINQADSDAPSAIKKDVDTIKKAVDQINTELQKAKSEKDLSGFGSKFDSLTNDKNLKASSDRVTTYTKKNCNIDLSS